MEKVIFSFIERRNARFVLSIVAFIASIAVVFVGIRANSILHDEAYMAFSCKNYENSPLAMMIFFVGNGWMSVFGDTYLSLRVLCRICILLALGVGLISLWKQTHNLLLTAVIGLISAMVSNLGDAGFYNWDNGAYPVEALGAVLLINYVSKPSLKYLCYLGLIGGIMTAFRLPLLAFSALVLIAVCGVNRGKTILTHILISATMFMAAWGLCVFLMTGSLGVYIGSFRSENIITGHSASVLQPYIDQFVRFFPRFVFFLLSTLVACLLGLMMSFWKRITILDFFWCELILIIIAGAFSIGFISNNSTTISGIGLPLLLLFLIWNKIGINWTNDRINGANSSIGLKSMLLFLMLLLEGFGSDTFFFRWTILFLFPISVGVVWPTMSVGGKRAIKLICILFIPYLAMMVPIKNKLIHSESEQIYRAKNSRVGGIYASASFVECYNKLSGVVDDLNKKKLKFEFVGQGIRYFYSYEFTNKLLDPSIFHLYHYKDDECEIMQTVAAKNDVIIALGEYTLTINYLQENCNYNVVESTPEYTVLKAVKKVCRD